MKRTVIFFLIISILFSCVSCAKNKEQKNVNTEPQISQMKAISELAVMECYYHTVAKFDEEGEKKFWGIVGKDKDFWIEYGGVVNLGIDVSLMEVTVNGTQVEITIPYAKVLDCSVDSSSLNQASYIVAKDSGKIHAEDEMKAFEKAESEMIKNASENKELLDQALQRTQMLLEEYINNIGTVAGKQYSITWNYISET